MNGQVLARVALSLQYEPGRLDLAAAVREQGAAAVLAGQLDAGVWLERAQAQVSACAAAGVGVLTPQGGGWPTQLDDLAAPPLVLYIRGAPLRPRLLRSLAIVGSRAATPEGQQIAFRWAQALAALGFSVVSGAAFGIDAAAHRGAMNVGGGTIAILAGGVDVASPRSHGALLASIGSAGTIVSEMPPGTPPARSRFLTRNRLIAALTPGTLVVQAAARSGALSTARQAADLNRLVMAVPGSVADPAHAGCHNLIRDQIGVLVGCVDDVAELLLPFSRGGPPAS